MAHSNGSSSPDPITLPSSPLVSPVARANRMKPLAQKSPNKLSSPSKSIIIDTPKKRGSSPWRIKVTVEAQPKHTRGSRTSDDVEPTAAIGAARMTSPAKRAHWGNREEETGRQARRRKTATPTTRLYAGTDTSVNDQAGTNDVEVVTEPSVSPLRQPPRRRSRMTAISATSQRSKRLSIARDELDEALQNAIGSPSSRAGSEIPGDMTVSANEDFSMVSMESLLSVKNTESQQNLDTILENTNSIASISHVPLSPPKVQYPEISGPARVARASFGRSDYDAMSWKPTGPAVELSFPHRSSAHHNANLELEQKEPDTEAVIISHAPENFEASKSAVQSPQTTFSEVDDDIWQEEASRSLGEEQPPYAHNNQTAQGARSPRFDDLFADQPQKPLRSKIPRTWRRSSGHDFSYIDSPAHVPNNVRKPSGTSTDRSGVLTPPSTDNDSSDLHAPVQQAEVSNEHSDFTQPDAMGTQFGEQVVGSDEGEDASVSSENEMDDSRSGTDSSVASPDAEDTGLFWQSNLPNIYRRERTRPSIQRQAPLDMTEMLGLEMADDLLDKHTTAPRTGAKTRPTFHDKGSSNKHGSNSIHMHPVIGKVDIRRAESQDGKLISSPLRRSLLRSSKIPASALLDSRKEVPPQYPASDRDENIEEPRDFDTFQSYEEQLNVQSPTRIQVKFNDSSEMSSFQDSGMESHQPRGKPSAVEKPPPHSKRTSPGSLPVKAGSAPGKPNTGLWSRLSTTLWSAVVRPSGPTELFPSVVPDRRAGESNVFPAALCTKLRNRYGVVSEQFPWTMAHMRTLHRMLNSRELNRADTLIPLAGALPPVLARLAADPAPKASVTGHRFVFTRAQAYVVAAFAQVLVPQHVVLAMRTGEVERLGDVLAHQCRGYYGDRHGDEPVWTTETHSSDVVRWVDGLNGRIDLDFIVKALGDVVWSNEQLASKHQRSRQ